MMKPGEGTIQSLDRICGITTSLRVMNASLPVQWLRFPKRSTVMGQGYSVIPSKTAV